MFYPFHSEIRLSCYLISINLTHVHVLLLSWSADTCSVFTTTRHSLVLYSLQHVIHTSSIFTTACILTSSTLTTAHHFYSWQHTSSIHDNTSVLSRQRTSPIHYSMSFTLMVGWPKILLTIGATGFGIVPQHVSGNKSDNSSNPSNPNIPCYSNNPNHPNN